ncbi:MAG: hypothetical protein F6K14_08455 [Symploca sp. SIO2C1]|nr:hypothetical protein [Symploca sp. SIO2C1]
MNQITANPQTTTNTQNQELANYQIAMSILKPLIPSGLRVEFYINFLGDPEVIAQSQLLSGAERLEFLIAAFDHIKDALRQARQFHL